MDIQNLNIEIIDTHDNERTLQLEKTGASHCHLIWNGSQDKYQPLIPSELHFSILLHQEADGELLHLLTGSETRYKVLINDTTDPQNIRILWQGHLLPEQYTEIYKNGNVFVRFIATDGIGRLRNLVLGDRFYQDQIPVLDVIRECLGATGSDLPLKIAPAILNADPNVTLDKIQIRTSSLMDSDRKMTAHKILEEILRAMGCKLFQIWGTWYVIGINRMHQDQLLTYDGELIDRDIYRPIYFASPSVSVLPPFRSVEINFDPKYRKSILPEDIIYQRSEDQTVNLNDTPVQHWKTVGISEDRLILTTKEAPANWIFCQLCYNYNPKLDPAPNSDPFWVCIRGYASDTSTDWIELESPVYVEKGVDLDLKMELMLYAKTYDLASKVGTNTLKDVFKYEILLDDLVILTNKTPIPYNGNFDFILKEDNDNAKATLEIKKLPLSKSGYLQIRISPPLPFDTSPEFYTLISKLEITHNYEHEGVELIREIDYTTKKEITVSFADDLKDLTDRSWVVSDYNLDTNESDPDVDVQLNILNYQLGQEPINQGAPPDMIDKHIFHIDAGSYALILNNPDDLYMLKDGETELTHLPASHYFINHWEGTSLWSIWTLDNGSFGQLFFEQNDQLFIRTNNPNLNITDERLLRTRWARYGNNEEIRYLDALAQIYHAASSANRFMVSGSVGQLVSPLDLLSFSFVSDRNYNPMRIDLDLFGGRSNLIMIESEYDENIEDYGTE